ncbi:hypothetical protein PanWU01x14_024820, partial [Parasponia andersonii]
ATARVLKSETFRTRLSSDSISSSYDNLNGGSWARVRSSRAKEDDYTTLSSQRG